ncbi:MAG: carboxypeptidase regulatory-like domain-containing protein [Acidobacteriota bacterium]
MKLRSYLLLICIVCFLVPALHSQSQSNTANLQGVVKDQTGAVVPGVQVTAKNIAIGLERSAATDDEGVYRIVALPPGEYEIRAELSGFSTQVRKGVSLTVGQFANLDFGLEISQQQTEVVVLGQTDIVETQKTQQASTIEEIEIDNLPINGRDFLDFTLLTPGVTSENTMVGFKAVQAPTSGLSFAGQGPRGNNVTMDGVSNIDSISNSVRSTLSQEATQEFQINRNSFSAEFGRATGGVINIVSKSGGNPTHGNLFGFNRDRRFDARNAFAFGPNRSDIDPPFSRWQYGVTLGGPIIRDRTFFFGALERSDRVESKFVTFTENPGIFQATASQKQLFEFFAAAPSPLLKGLADRFNNPTTGLLLTTPLTFPSTLQKFQSESGTFPFASRGINGSFKIDHSFSAHNQMFVRINANSFFNNNAEFGALQAVSNGVKFDVDDAGVAVSDTHIFTPTTLNEAKFQFSNRRFRVATNDPVGPDIILQGVAEFGREFFNPTHYVLEHYQWIDNLTLIRGNHSLKFGVDFNHLSTSGAAEVFLGGQFNFAQRIPLGAILGASLTTQLATLLATPVSAGGLGRADLVPNLTQHPLSSVQAFNFGVPVSYFQGFGDPRHSFTYGQHSAYVQDSWHASRQFTLNFGIRYDIEPQPDTQNVVSTTAPWRFTRSENRDTNNFSGRFGFAWSPGGGGKTVLRGGYGLYYASFFQAIAFVSQVLSGQIAQTFLPITGLPGITTRTSADVFAAYRQTGRVNRDTLATLGISPGTTPTVILPAADDVVSPYSHHASLGIERELFANTSLSVDYILNRGAHLIRSRDINAREVSPNRFGTPGLDPRFVQVNMIETSGSSIYHGMTAVLRKRFARHVGINVNYTLGKAIDDTTDFITPLQANNPRDHRSERSRSVFDERHRFVASGVLETPWGAGKGNRAVDVVLGDWMLAPIFTYASGKPFNLLLGFDANNDTHDLTDRPFLASGQIAGRNTGRGPDYYAFDLRLTRRVQIRRERGVNLELLVEAFNLFNRTNFSGVNNVAGATPLQAFDVEGRRGPTTSFLGFTSAFDPRQIQFGFKLNF